MIAPDPTQATDALKFLHPDGAVFELCCLGLEQTTGPWKGRAFGKEPLAAGWFTDKKKATQIASQISAAGIYVTLNPCLKALLARANQRLKANVARTSDKEIDHLRNLLVDVDSDPGGPAGISSTDQEHKSALEMVQIIKTDLAKEGWPEPLEADSGNGGHLIFAVDLPNNEESKALIKSGLEALSLRYKDELSRRNLGIDTSVFNPARLTKLYGTAVKKGDSIPDRPHRLAKIIYLPEERRSVPVELLENLAATIPPQAEDQKKETQGETCQGRLDVEKYLAHYGREVVKVKPHAGGFLYCLKECAFDASHSPNEAAIFQAANGTLSYKCFHDSCKGRAWAEARKVISGDDKLTPFMLGGNHYRERKFSSCAEECGDLEKAIQEGTLTPEQKKYLINLIGKNGEISQPANLAADVKQLILSSSGRITSADVVKELGLSSLSSNRQFNKNLSKIFERLVKDGLLERLEKRGDFLIVNQIAEEIPWKEVGEPTPVDLKQPLKLHELVYFYPGNVIVIGGSYNAGKTVYCLNTACLNMDHWKVNYLSSEMTPEELAARLYNFKAAGLVPDIDAWNKVKFRQRRHDFHQVIDPDGLNIIDYLEMNKEFYGVGGMIDRIFQKLNKGLAVIAIQKAPGETHARGGAFTVEKARFAVSIDYQKLKIIKAKNLKPGVKDPTNQVIDFQTIAGTKMIRAN